VKSFTIDREAVVTGEDAVAVFDALHRRHPRTRRTVRIAQKQVRLAVEAGPRKRGGRHDMSASFGVRGPAHSIWAGPVSP
jgi:hypothetical protein